MKKQLLFKIAVLLITTITIFVFVTHLFVKPINTDDASINGFRAKGILKYEKSINKLGNLILVSDSKNIRGRFKSYLFSNYMLLVRYEAKSQSWMLDRIIIYDKNFKTNRGIRVGDNIIKVMMRYGLKGIKNHELVYGSLDKDKIIRFLVTGNKVEMIILQ